MSLGLVAIVRDEATRISPMLESLRPHVSAWTVLDTGSKDETPAIVREVLDGIPGQLLEEHFVDFGTTRSRAFAAARDTADWLIASDADMVWSIDDGWTPDPAVDAYLVDMGGPTGFSNRLPLLLAGDLPWVSVGACHEYTALAGGGLGRREPTDAVRISMPAAAPMTEAKLEWHAQLLTAALVERPDDARSVFYLAQTRRDQGRLGEAVALYNRRAEMGGWDEETWYASYMAATLAPSWIQRQDQLLAAWESRPHRLEPLYDLVHGLNERGRHRAAYRLSDVPLAPTPDILFVHRGVWEWGMAAERQRALAALT